MKIRTTVSFLLIGLSLYSQNPFETNKNKSPRIMGDTIIIYFGDTLFFECNLDRGKNIDIKQVHKSTAPKNEIQLMLVETGFGGKSGTMMKITNPFNKPIRYNAEMKIKGQENFIKTTVVPVYPKMFSMEMWPEKLEVLRLTDFKLK